MVDDPYFREHHYVGQYENGHVRALNNIFTADLTAAEFRDIGTVWSQGRAGCTYY